MQRTSTHTASPPPPPAPSSLKGDLTSSQVIAYVRASLDHPDDKAQLLQLQQLAEDLGLPAPTPFIDTDGHTLTPAWSNLLAACHQDEVRVILVVAFHRFAGSLRQLTQTLDKLAARDVRLISEADQFDSASSRGRIIAQGWRCVADFEQAGRSERVREGQERVKREGRSVGRPKVHTS